MSIDYGRYPMANGQLPNRDPDTGIRYGIARSHDLADWFLDECEPDYPECECEDECECEPIGWSIESDGVVASLDEQNDVWIFKSPVITHGAHCSPCAPGAVTVTRLGTGEVEAYGLPDDCWRHE